MWYVIFGQDCEGSLARRKANRPAHLARLELLREVGRLLLAGPCPAIDSPDPGLAGFTGTLIVAEFDSLTLAQAWAKEDPYLAGGAWERVDVRPFLKVLP